MNIKNLCLLSGVLLLLAIPPMWPYGFYILLRWVVFIMAVLVAYGFHKANIQGWTWVFGAVALLFNPIIPFYLSKSTWVAIDLVASCLFFISAFSITKGVKKL